VAARLGIGLREARKSSGLTERQLAARAVISQARVSEVERGHGAAASLETWSCLAAAADEQLVGFLERGPGADQPRDMEHLRRQSALIDMATRGGWTAHPELAIDPGLPRSRAIDIALVRAASREAVAVEIWDWFDDIGASLRGLDAKVSTLELRVVGLAPELLTAEDHDEEARTPPGEWRVRGLFVVRATRRNRALVGELRPLFAARFDGSSVAWLRALRSPSTSIPTGHGLLWSDRNTDLSASRLGRR
jgi:transcriptional regulator with XRE-family HTH domain